MMHKDYQVKTFFKGTSKRSRYSPEEEEGWRGFSSHGGNMTFSYKGLVIVKRNSLYQVRDVKLEGFPVQSISGIYNDSRALRTTIDIGLAQSSPDKLEALRMRNRNVKCGDCNTPFLFRREMLIDHQGWQVISCPYCSHEEFEDRLEWATDESFY